MASSDRRTRRGTFAAFRRPVVTDLVFWLAVGLAVLFGLVVSAALLMVLGLPDGVLGWIWPVGAFAASGWLGFKLLAMGINTSRALEPSAEPVDEARAQSLENTGRAAGAVLGKGAAKLVRRKHPPAPVAEPEPEPQRAPTAEAEPTPEVTVDKAARVIGSMVGRRLADRKRPEQ
ncbi:MAG TPA: hypothetical protein VIY72_07115 [Acidimicrobiales bacterium]